MYKYPFQEEHLLMKVDVDLSALFRLCVLLKMACNFGSYIWAWLFFSLCRKVWYDVIQL